MDDFEAEVLDATQRRREALAVAFLCAAREFDELPVRHNEDIENSDLASQLLDDDAETIDGLLELGYDSPHAKAQLLIHAKLRDGKLPIADYATDQRSVLEQAPRVLAALIDENTQKALKFGIFGVPSFSFSNEIFWGDDRLEDAVNLLP